MLELKWWYQVQWFKRPDNEREKFPLSQHLVEKSLDSTEESWDSTEESWDSTVLGQYSLGIVVLGQYQAVLGQWSWDSSLGTVVLGQCSLGTVQSWDSSLGTE